VDTRARRTDLGLRHVETRERVRIDRRAELGEGNAEREVGRRRREEITAVERPRHRFQRIIRIGELVRLGDSPELLGSRNEQSVVWPDVDAALAIA
jgi:hypothetical protein